MGRQTPAAEIFRLERKSRCELSFFGCRVSAGFPSPAEDYLEGKLDLNDYLIRHPAATFFVRVSGDSMVGAGIHPGDLLVVDRAIAPIDGSVIIAVLDAELTVKRLRTLDGQVFLVPDNPSYPTFKVNAHCEFEVWGVVTAVIHKLSK